MFTPAPTEQELAVAGLTIADLEGAAVEVWPENLQAYKLFSDLQTQWNVGMGGPVGLNYMVLFAKLDRMGLAGTDADDLEEDIRTMEHEALLTMSEREAS